MRQMDMVTRDGGEEFLVVLPDTTMDGAAGFRRLAAEKKVRSSTMEN